MEQLVGIQATRWWVVGAQPDIDAAWDEAKDLALAEWGNNFAGADAYADDFERREAALPFLVARSASDATAYCAQALARPADWATRRARVVLTGTHLKWGAEGDTFDPNGELDAALLEALVESGRGLVEGERIAEASLLSVKRRTKVVTERFAAPSQKKFAVVVDSRIITRVDSLTEARAAAKVAAPTGTAQVWALSGRVGDQPLFEAREQVVSQRATCSLSIVRPKRPDVNRVNGWLFSGDLAAAPEGE